MRQICPACNSKPVAINYTKNGVTHYRTKCDSCTRKNKKIVPKWVKVGYKKKPQCECCGFKARYQEQLSVCFVDNNTNNTVLTNIKTVCLNCYATIVTMNLGWSNLQVGLVADL